jgi:ribosomal-protein-serine acetyltransferase
MTFNIAPNLSMRILGESDADILFKVVDANRDHLRAWLPWLDRNRSAKDSQAFIEGIIGQEEDGLGFACGIFWETNLVGMCGFHEIDKREQSVVIGYWLSEDYQGKGIVSQCTSFFISYAFDELGLEKVWIPVAEGNTRSRRLCERLGLTSEGVSKDAEWLYDR